MIKLTFTERIKKSFGILSSIEIDNPDGKVMGYMDLEGIEETYSTDIVKSNLDNNCLRYNGVIINKDLLNKFSKEVLKSLIPYKSLIQMIGYDLKEKCFILVCKCFDCDDQLIMWTPIDPGDPKIKVIRREPVADNQKIKVKYINLTDKLDGSLVWRI